MRTILYLALISCLGIPTLSAQKDSLADPWTRYTQPGKVHEFLSDYKGSWQQSSHFWMAAGQKPQTFLISASAEMLLGGRFLQIKQNGLLAGMPYEGTLLLGFNTTSEEFTCVQTSNFGTGSLVLSGRWTEPFKSIELRGEMKSPETRLAVKVRQNIIFTDTDHFRIENYDQQDGSAEFKSAEYVFSRSALLPEKP